MRKALVILVAFLLLTGITFGAEYPVDKGSTMISGGFGFANASGNLYEDSKGNSATTLQIDSRVLRFVIPNFGLGGAVKLSRASQGDNSNTMLAIGPELGYFVGGPDSKTYPFFGMGFGYLRNSFERGSWGGEKYEFTSSGTKFWFGAGVAFMVGSHLAIGCEGTYNLDNLKPEDGKSESGSILILSVGLAGFIF